MEWASLKWAGLTLTLTLKMCWEDPPGSRCNLSRRLGTLSSLNNLIVHVKSSAGDRIQAGDALNSGMMLTHGKEQV